MRIVNKEKIKIINRNKDYRALMANFSYLTLLQVAGYIFPLITIPYLSRVLGANGLGRIAFGTAVITWFMSISTWGFNFTATRDAARNRDNIDTLSDIFSNVLWARLALTSICLIILFVLTLIIPSFRENWLILAITFLTIPTNILFPEWMFQALERMKYITILSLASRLFFTVAIFVFIKDSSDYYIEPLLNVIGSFVSGMIALYFIIVRWGIRINKPSIRSIQKTIKGSTDVFINNFMPNLYNSMSFILLGSFAGSVATGILSAGDRLISICQQFFNILARAFFPFLSRHGEKHSIYARISIISAIVFAIMIFLFSPLFMRLFYTEEFNDAVVLSRIMAFSIVFLIMNNVYGVNYLILNGHEKQLRNIQLVSSVCGLIVAIPLIYYWNYYGAAVTIVLVRAVISTLIYFYSKKVEKELKNKK